MQAVDLSTEDVDRARIEVGRVFCPHRLLPHVGVPKVRLALASRRIGGVGVVDLDYGRGVRIQPEPLETFYLVQIPRQGRAKVCHGSTTVNATPETASVLSPFESSDMHWYEGAPHRIFYVARTSLDRELGRLLGRPVEDRVRLDVGMAMTTAAARAWARGVDFLFDELSYGAAAMFDHPQVARRFEEALVAKLLLVHRHSYSELLTSATGHPAPSRLVRRARTLIRDHHDEPLSVGDVAEALGVSVRTLQECFRKELDTTPTAYLRNCRLDAVHRALRAADPTARVTRIALQHGFVHMGRFAGAYRARFGESPSDTLRR